jgi:ketosteroid isomerase-like protein
MCAVLDISSLAVLIALQAVSDGKTMSGKPYNNEFMMTFRFDGNKIKSVEEFMDSNYAVKVLESEDKGADMLMN